MARICSQCSLPNPDRSIFCSRCGATLPSDEVTGDAPPASPNNYAPTPAPSPQFVQQGYVAQGNNAPSPDEPHPYIPPQAPPAAGPMDNAPSPQQQDFPSYPPTPGPAFGARPNDPYGAPGGMYGPTGPQPQLQQQMPFPGQQAPQSPQSPSSQRPGQRSMPDLNLAVVQRAFAGKGTPMTHASWLVDGKQVDPADLRVAIVEKVQQRYPNELKASQEHLSERDAVLEERDYVKIERAPASVYIYVTRFGPDLYISRATTVQPALSPVRIAVLGLLFLLMIIGFIIGAATSPSAVLFKANVSLFSAILLIFFIAIVLRSIVLWLTEKDYLVYLRSNVLNDFRLDDGAILEHIADRGTREAAEGLGLEARDLAGSPRNYPARQPLHRI